MFDPRREERRQKLRVPLPEDVDARDLDAEVRHDLRSLAKDTAELTAKHLVMAGRLIDEDPVQALAHARAAAALAGRVGAVREAAGLAAYAAGEWALALSELRTARRVTGRADHLAVLADCERALGRPERALAALDDPDVARLDQATRVELVIVVAGARRDLGELDAAVLLLQTPATGTRARHPWAARLWYAYADALLAAGRPEAREWFARAADVDELDETGAQERLLELDGVVFGDDGDGSVEPDAEGEGGEPSVSLAELGLAPVTAGVQPHRRGVVAPAPVGSSSDGPSTTDAAAPSPGTSATSAAEDGPAAAPGPGSSSLPTPVHEAAASPVPDAPPSSPAPERKPVGATGRATGSPLFSDLGSAVDAPVPPPTPADGDGEDLSLGQQELFSDLPDRTGG